MLNNDIDTLLAKQNIRDVLSHYCRGLDRMDKTLARSVFDDDAPAHYYDVYQGTGHGFIDYVWQAHATMQRHSHQISNVLIDVHGDTAVSESYVTVLLWTKPDSDGQQREIVIRGRYLDRWRRRQQQWVIVNRIHVVDTHTVSDLCSDASGQKSAVYKGPVSEQSAANQTDPSFELFGR